MDVAPFRQAGSTDGQPPLCSFFTDGDKTGNPSKKGRALAHPAADDTPCATHVINWIEDNFMLGGGKSCQGGNKGQPNNSITAAMVAGGETLEAKDRGMGDNGSSTGKDSWSGGVEGGNGDGGATPSLAAAATVGAVSLEPVAATLPNVVGAGGFSEFIPLIDATIGR